MPIHARREETANILDLVITNEDDMIEGIQHEAHLEKPSRLLNLHFQILPYIATTVCNANSNLMGVTMIDYDGLTQGAD